MNPAEKLVIVIAAVAGNFLVCAACGLTVQGSSDGVSDSSSTPTTDGAAPPFENDASSSSGEIDAGGGDSGDEAGLTTNGSLKVTSTMHSGNVNLSVDSQTDWAFWAANPVERKRNVLIMPRPINTFTELVGRTMTCATGSATTFTWTDGSPTQNQSAPRSDICGYQADTADIFFQFPALTTKQTLTLYLGGSLARTAFEARLSDSSAPPVIDGSQSSTTANFSSRFVIEFNARTAGATLDIHWKLLSRVNDGFITIKAATLN